MPRKYTRKVKLTNFEQFPIDFYFVKNSEWNDKQEKWLYEEAERVSHYCKSAVYEAHNGCGIMRASDGKDTFWNDTSKISSKVSEPFITESRIAEINKYRVLEVWENGERK